MQSGVASVSQRQSAQISRTQQPYEQIKTTADCQAFIFYPSIATSYRIHYFLKIAMSSNFLNKFQGKMTVISRLGPDNLLKGTDGSIIYTNTTKSFGRDRRTRPSNNRQDTEQSFKRLSEEITQQKHSLQLPSLGERYLSQQSKHQAGRVQKKGLVGYFDKQTNWLIEDYPRVPSPISNINTATHPLTAKDNFEVRTFPKKHPQRNNSVSKLGRLGGLGPNIGGEEWLARNAKKQKALIYANNLRKKKREKVQQNQDTSIIRSFNGRSIAMYD